jgi:foldase protein PrsA
MRVSRKESMLKRKRLISRSKSTAKVTQSESVKRQKRKNNIIITVSAILAVIVTVIGIGWYLIFKAPLQRPIIKVNNDTVTIEYFLKRCLMNSSSASVTQDTIQMIIQELLIKQGATQYGITVTEADIDQELRYEANQSSTATTTTTTETTTPADITTPTTIPTTATLSDAEFEEWYRQQLDQSKLSEKEFRDLIRIYVMGNLLQTLFANNVPSTAEQVYLYDIVLPDLKTATEVKARLDAGEDFVTVASEISLDTNTKDKGGDMGWVPINVLDSTLENTVTNLDIGQVSDPVQTSTAAQQAASTGQAQPYIIFMVTEKAVARQVDSQYMPSLQERAMQDWIDYQMNTQKITLIGRGTGGAYDAETEAWIQYQLQKM